jgi:hypothetical protein
LGVGLAVMVNLDALACGSCRVTAVQLWRDYGGFFREHDVRCQQCAEREQKKPRDGDSIGWLVPLVTDPEGRIWGYTSAPESDIRRWRELPAKAD